MSRGPPVRITTSHLTLIELHIKTSSDSRLEGFKYIQFQTDYIQKTPDPPKGHTAQAYRNRNRNLAILSRMREITVDPIPGEALQAVTGAADSLKSDGQAVMGKATQSKVEGK